MLCRCNKNFFGHNLKGKRAFCGLAKKGYYRCVTHAHLGLIWYSSNVHKPVTHYELYFAVSYQPALVSIFTESTSLFCHNEMCIIMDL